jgi:acyl-CoA synthetase (AMP-forming)/AMP-acid ligase II
MGVTTLIPDMDPTKPATVDPEKIVTAMHDQGVTQAFGSPAMWNRIGRYCEERGIQFPTLRRVLSAGAPVPPHVLTRMRKTLVLPGADINTPYGATESLPVCSIDGKTVLEKTAEKTKTGAGTCVGKPFDGVDVKIIQITDTPIASWNDATELPAGEIGEVAVKGPMATREYYNRPEATAAAKISDGTTFWHRMGDVGYLDEEGALWFCGRKAHIVHSASGSMFSIPCEAIFNEHAKLYRSALVGIGEQGSQMPVIIAEPEAEQFPESESDKNKLTEELLELGVANPLTADIKTVLFHRSLPVDTRHNVKIKRELLVPWAEKVLK